MRTVSFFSALWWKRAFTQFSILRSYVGAGVLAALGVVLKALTIPITTTLRISFAFLAPALTGYLYGPVVAGTAAAVVDILGYLVNPGGPFFPGFTLNAFVGGFIFGCWLYLRPVRLWRTACAMFTFILCVNFMLNPLWLSMLYGDAFIVLMLARIPTNAVVLPAGTAVLFTLLKAVERNVTQLARW